MRWKRLVAIPLLAAVVACGGGDDEAPQASSTFCQHAADFEEATKIEPGSVGTMLDGFTRLAEIYRSMATTAPAEIRAEVARLADSAAAVAARLREAEPASMEELIAANDRITPGLEQEFGDLDPAAATVSSFVEEQCGVDIEE